MAFLNPASKMVWKARTKQPPMKISAAEILDPTNQSLPLRYVSRVLAASFDYLRPSANRFGS
jgi:hypothetical protein